MSENFANQISAAVLKFFDNLAKSGKPNNNEWTILSAIVKTSDASNENFEIVALGTGTKCLPSNLLSDDGAILNDSHAEICCRRAFLRYLLWELQKQSSSIFQFNEESKKFKLQEDIRFHFYSTAVPCGDANIFQLDSEDGDEEPATKRPKVAENVGFTGAKLIKSKNSQVEDEMEQTEGAIRIKPGKGVRTLSLSCSDKMARWNILGIQGCMLFSLLKEPIYLESFILADGVSFSEAALKRALFSRFSDVEKHLGPPFKHQYPQLLFSTNKLNFKFSKSGSRENPSPTSIIWSKVPEKPLEVSVAGKKQGVTKKDLKTPKARLQISKIELFSQYIRILNNNPDLKTHLYSSVNSLNDLCYKDVKTLKTNKYFEQWRILKKNYFEHWTEKPENLLIFCGNL